MPELPEVEYVARMLNERVSGRRIRSAELRRVRLAPQSPPDDFAARLENSAVNFVHRRGKYILFDLDNSRTLLTHLRMSGRFLLLGGKLDDPKFTHAVFHFHDGMRLAFDDQRHFGLMKVIETAEINLDRSLAALAPEPFSDEFGVDYLRSRLAASGRSLKEFLLDQSKVCGLGNIYASEAMFRAGLSPRRLARNVPRTRLDLLHTSIRDVLNEALELAIGKVPDPVVIGERVYGNGIRADWHVYDREGKPCVTCETPVRRIRQGLRSTYYCPKCQR